jgi:hypothetical protein
VAEPGTAGLVLEDLAGKLSGFFRRHVHHQLKKSTLPDMVNPSN